MRNIKKAEQDEQDEIGEMDRMQEGSKF